MCVVLSTANLRSPPLGKGITACFESNKTASHSSQRRGGCNPPFARCNSSPMTQRAAPRGEGKTGATFKRAVATRQSLPWSNVLTLPMSLSWKQRPVSTVSFQARLTKWMREGDSVEALRIQLNSPKPSPPQSPPPPCPSISTPINSLSERMPTVLTALTPF